MPRLTPKHWRRVLLLPAALLLTALLWFLSRPLPGAAAGGDPSAGGNGRAGTGPAPKPARLVRPAAIIVPLPAQQWAERNADPAASSLAATLLAQLRGSQDDVAAAFLSAVELDTRNRIAFAAAALRLADPGFRVDALGLLARTPARQILPLIAQGMRDAQPEVRAAALALLEAFSPEWDQERQQALANLAGGGEFDPELLEGLSEDDRLLINQAFAGALSDADADVRAQAMQSLLQLDYDTQQHVFANALLSEHEDVRLELVQILASASNKDNIDLTFAALDDSSPSVRQTAENTLLGVFSENFDSASQARAWWLRQQKKYDHELVQQDDSF